MGQPIRKNIQEKNSDIISEAPIYTLLVDGGSLLFHCFASNTVNSEGVHYGGVEQFLYQLRKMYEKKDFDYVYVFFDNTYSGWLRWNLYNEYKQNRDKKYHEYGISDYMKQFNEVQRSMMKYFTKKQKPKKTEEEMTKSDKFKKFVDDNFDRERDILCEMFNEMFIRWNIDEITEGDDQIAYYCLNKKSNEKVVIMTGDMDLTQLIADDITVYYLSMEDKKFITPKNFKDIFGYHYKNVLTKKIFTGDVSDNIGNIKGLSEDGFFKLMPEAYVREVTVEEVKSRAEQLINDRKNDKKKPLQLHENIINGVSNKEYNGDFYEINRQIIDLKHPLLSEEAKEEMDNMMHAPIDPEGRSFGNLYRLIVKNKIENLMGDTKFSTFFNLFKRLEKKEIDRYNKWKENNK